MPTAIDSRTFMEKLMHGEITDVLTTPFSIKPKRKTYIVRGKEINRIIPIGNFKKCCSELSNFVENLNVSNIASNPTTYASNFKSYVIILLKYVMNAGLDTEFSYLTNFDIGKIIEPYLSIFSLSFTSASADSTDNNEMLELIGDKTMGSHFVSYLYKVRKINDPAVSTHLMHHYVSKVPQITIATLLQMDKFVLRDKKESNSDIYENALEAFIGALDELGKQCTIKYLDTRDPLLKLFINGHLIDKFTELVYGNIENFDTNIDKPARTWLSEIGHTFSGGTGKINFSKINENKNWLDVTVKTSDDIIKAMSIAFNISENLLNDVLNATYKHPVGSDKNEIKLGVPEKVLENLAKIGMSKQKYVNYKNMTYLNSVDRSKITIMNNLLSQKNVFLELYTRVNKSSDKKDSTLNVRLKHGDLDKAPINPIYGYDLTNPSRLVDKIISVLSVLPSSNLEAQDPDDDTPLGELEFEIVDEDEAEIS